MGNFTKNHDFYKGDMENTSFSFYVYKNKFIKIKRKLRKKGSPVIIKKIMPRLTRQFILKLCVCFL